MTKKLPLIALILFSVFISAQTITDYSTGYTNLEGIAVDSNNTVFVTELYTGNIYQLDAAGTQTLFATTGFRAVDIVFDVSNNLYVGEPFNDKILSVDVSGVVTEYVDVLGSTPYGLDFNNGLLYFAAENTGKIIQVNADLSTTDYSTGYFTPEGIAFDSSGNLYIADRNDKTLFKVTPTGTVTTIASNIDNIRGVAVAPDDTVYFTKYKTFPLENKILKYDPVTTNITEFVTTDLDEPRSIAIDNLGNLYVNNAGSGKVIKIYDDALLPATSTDIVNIPDANFKAALINNAFINTNSDSEIQVTEAATFTGNIMISNLNISDLTGIEAFTQINFLNCSNNLLSSLDISTNTNLTGVSCGNNLLTNLEVTNNTALTSISARFNSITNLDVSFNTDLIYLRINNNNISTINLLNNTQLLVLDCFLNQLTSLDVSANVNLEDLDFGGNDISSIDLTNNTALKFLDLQQANLSQLDVSNNPVLEKITSNDNDISTLDLSNNTGLIELNCPGNNLTTLNLTNNIAFEDLWCSYNNLTTLDLRNGNNLNITYFNSNDNPALTCIFVDDKDYSIANWTNPNPGTTNFVEIQAECDATLTVTDFDTSAYKIFPNPATNLINIETNSSFIKVAVYSIQGKKLLESVNTILDIEHLSKGIYLIKITGNNNQNHTERLIKE